jgi:hypothetical protein
MTSADYFEQMRHTRCISLTQQTFFDQLASRPATVSNFDDARDGRFLIGENEIASICSAPLAIFIVYIASHANAVHLLRERKNPPCAALFNLSCWTEAIRPGSFSSLSFSGCHE